MGAVIIILEEIAPIGTEMFYHRREVITWNGFVTDTQVSLHLSH